MRSHALLAVLLMLAALCPTRGLPSTSTMGEVAPPEQRAGSASAAEVGHAGSQATFESKPVDPRDRLVIPSLKVVPISETEAVATWYSRKPTSSEVAYRGAIAVFSKYRPVGKYVQAVCYAPEEYGDSITAELIDRDLEDIAISNANCVNLYGLSTPVLGKRDTSGCHATLEEHLLARCRSLGLRVIARLETYPSDFAFTKEDAEWVAAYYRRSLDMTRAKYKDTVLYYLINMPLDDSAVRSRFPFHFVPLERQREYVRALRKLLWAISPRAKVRAIVHYAVVDDIPVAPVTDLVDGVALVAYPARCNSAPFTTGLPVVSCGWPPSSGSGPSLDDPANVVIGKDQLDYWIEKARTTNELAHRGGLAMDGVGFAHRLGHWSGIVSDYRTKVQASRWLADYLFEDRKTDGYSYFMLHDKDEGPFGIVVPNGSVSDPTPATRHEVHLTNLSPGARYKLWAVQEASGSRPVYFQMPFPCEVRPWPRLSITSPGYGGVIAPDPNSFEVRWTSNLPARTSIAIYADPDDRGLDGILLTHAVVAAGCAKVDLSGLRPGGYYLYATANIEGCSVPGNMIWDYSTGRVLKPVSRLSARRAAAPIVVDGVPGERVWDAVDWTTFAVHPPENDLCRARVKLLWDDNYLYVAFDVDDGQVETNPVPNTWDSDSVSLWLWGGTPPDDYTSLCRFAKESRQGPCDGSSKPLGKAHWSLKGSSTCNDKSDVDAGYWIEMAVPWSQVHLVPMVGNVISADLLSVDHDYNPGGQYNAPATRFSKVFWTSDGCWLGGAIVLEN